MGQIPGTDKETIDKGEVAPEARRSFSWDDHFYGAVTVGERGQLVIPVEARKRFHIEPGDKLLIMGDPGKRGLMLCKIDEMREFMTLFQEGLARVEREMGDVSTSTQATPNDIPPSREDKR